MNYCCSLCLSFPPVKWDYLWHLVVLQRLICPRMSVVILVWWKFFELENYWAKIYWQPGHGAVRVSVVRTDSVRRGKDVCNPVAWPCAVATRWSSPALLPLSDLLLCLGGKGPDVSLSKNLSEMTQMRSSALPTWWSPNVLLCFHFTMCECCGREEEEERAFLSSPVPLQKPSRDCCSSHRSKSHLKAWHPWLGSRNGLDVGMWFNSKTNWCWRARSKSSEPALASAAGRCCAGGGCAGPCRTSPTAQCSTACAPDETHQTFCEEKAAHSQRWGCVSPRLTVYPLSMASRGGSWAEARNQTIRETEVGRKHYCSLGQLFVSHAELWRAGLRSWGAGGNHKKEICLLLSSSKALPRG